MKKIFIVLFVFVLLFSGCNNLSGNEETSIKENETQETTELQAVFPEETTSSDLQESLEAEPVGGDSSKMCYYGENTGTDKTYTGLEPLSLNDFSLSDMNNSKALPTKEISHSYGVAKNGTPHEISINNQKFFDENNYDAVCFDNKTTDKVLYLTFDCGYENGYTSKILDVLRDKNVKAAFFCTLPQVKSESELIARMINEGHIVGNHSVTHPDFSSLTRTQMIEELKGFDDYMRENFGYSSFYFRYPQGKYNENSLDALNSLGYKCVFWSLAYADWDLENQKGSSFALETVVSRLHPGAVILLHSVSPDNANALADIIDTALSMGYEFRSLEQM